MTDLAFDPAEGSVLEMRASRMSGLRKYVEDNGLPRAEAAERFSVAPSRVSDLVRGTWERFSLEILITLEARVGRAVQVQLVA